MNSLRASLLIGCFALTSFASDSLVKMVVGNGSINTDGPPQPSVCVLGFPSLESPEQDQKTAKCWDREARPVETPMLKSPIDIAVGHRLGGVYGNYVCLANGEKIDCSGEQGPKIKGLFMKLKQPYLLAAGNYDICAVDKIAGVKCVSGEIPVTRWTKIEETTPPLSGVSEIAVGSFYACAIVGNRVSCWGGVRDPYVNSVESQAKAQLSEIHKHLLMPPQDLVRPHDLSVGLSHACVIDEGKPRCWGVPLAGEMGFPINTDYVQALDASLKRTCAIIAGQLKCKGIADASVTPFLVGDGAEFPLAFAASKDQHAYALTSCIFEPETVICRGRISFSVKHAILGFHLYNIENEFERLSRHVYEWKAPILARAALQLRKMEKQDQPTDLSRLFLANAMKTFAGSIQNTYFETLVIPRLTKVVDYYNNRFQKAGLMEMAKDTTNAKLGLYLLRECYAVSRELLSEKAEIESVKELDARLVKALAAAQVSAGELKGVLDQLANMKALSDRLAASPTSSGIMELAKQMAKFLRAY